MEHCAEGVSSGSASAQPTARLHQSVVKGSRRADGDGEAGGLGRLSRPCAVSVQNLRQPHHQVHPVLAHVQQEGQRSPRGPTVANETFLSLFVVSAHRTSCPFHSDDARRAELRRSRAGRVVLEGEGLCLRDNDARAAGHSEAAGNSLLLSSTRKPHLFYFPFILCCIFSYREVQLTTPVHIIASNVEKTSHLGTNGFTLVWRLLRDAPNPPPKKNPAYVFLHC